MSNGSRFVRRKCETKAAHHMNIFATEEKWKLGAPDGKRPVPAGALSRHEARPLLAAEAAPPAGRGKNGSPNHSRGSPKSTDKTRAKAQNKRTIGSGQEKEHLRLPVRPAGRLLDQATAVHDADEGRAGPAAGHNLRPPVACARRRASGLVSGAVSPRDQRGGWRGRTFSRRHGASARGGGVVGLERRGGEGIEAGEFEIWVCGACARPLAWSRAL